MKKLTVLQKQQYQLIGDYLTQLPSEGLISHAKTDEQKIEPLTEKVGGLPKVLSFMD